MCIGTAIVKRVIELRDKNMSSITNAKFKMIEMFSYTPKLGIPMER